MSQETFEHVTTIDDHDPLPMPADTAEIIPDADGEPDAAEPESAEVADTTEKVEPAPSTESDASLASLRDQMSQRIASSRSLPRGMRERLAEALRQAPLVADGNELLAPVEMLVGVIENWAPDAFRFDPSQLRPLDHPAGETFFTGDPHDLSDEQAAAIARRQLQLTGYLPRGDSR